MQNKYVVFLKKYNISSNQLTAIEQDASSRKYFKIKNNKNFLLMDSPPAENNNDRFITISKHLNKINLSAPKIITSNKDKSLILIENFGDNTFNKALNNKISEFKLYRRAVDTLLEIHKNDLPKGIPVYSKDILMNEVNLFIEWYCNYKNINLSLSSKNKWNSIWNKYLEPLTKSNNKLVLRDFHVDNLFWLESRKNIKKVGIIDFQDTLIGNIEYDLSSLLEDVRKDISDKTKNDVFEYFISNSNIDNINKFKLNYKILTAQRNAKIAGIFVRLAERDKKTRYLSMINKAILIFKKSAKDANLLELLNWLEDNSVN